MENKKKKTGFVNYLHKVFKSYPISDSNGDIFEENKTPLDIAIEQQRDLLISNNYKKIDNKLVLKDDAPAYFAGFGVAGMDPASIKFPGYPFLMSLTQNPLIRNGVQKIANDMTKNWCKINTLKDDQKDRSEFVTRKLENLNCRETFKKGEIATGYYGGCLIYVEIVDSNGNAPNDEELKTPIWDDNNEEVAKVKLKGMRVNRLKVIEPWNFTSMGYDTTTPTRADFYEPTYYIVMGKEIHASRFLRLRENYCPQIYSPIYNFLGIPTAQLAFDYAYGFESARKSINKLIRKYSLLVFGTNLKPDDNSFNATKFIQNRLNALAKGRDNNSIALFDKDTETFENITTPISGLDPLWTKQLELMTIPFQLPIVKLLGASPSGFSTGDTELTNYYDAISTNQVSVFETELLKLNKMIDYTNPEESKEPVNFVISWNPIRTMTDKEIAELSKIRIDADTSLMSSNIISAEEVRNRISKDEFSGYNGIDADLVPEVPEPDDTDEDDLEPPLKEDEKK